MKVLATITVLAACTSALCAAQPIHHATSARPRQVIAYVFPRGRALQPADISARKLTRINYAFSNIDGGKIIEGSPQDPANYAALHALKTSNPDLEVLSSVGGWSWSKHFSDVALTSTSRRIFIDSALSFIRRYNLDGLDVDWEYPGQLGDNNTFRPQDRDNYTALLRELRQSFDHEEQQTHHHLLLTIAVNSEQTFLDHTDMRQVARYVDTVNLMAYDLYGSEKNTGHQAPLFTNPHDPKHVSADDGVRRYVAVGVPAEKLVLGVPFYGKGWRNVGPTAHGLFQPGVPAPDLELNYRDIANTLLQPGSGYTRYWDSTAQNPYLYNGATRTWVDYEDPQSLRRKASYVVEHHLAGIMFWQYFGDRDDALTDAIDQGLGVDVK